MASNVEVAEPLWSLWELFGGTRGDMLTLLAGARPTGLEQQLVLVTFGPGGYWPHVVGLWRIEGAANLERALSLGAADGVDEARFTWGKSKLLRRVAGAFVPGRVAYLLEFVRMSGHLGADSIKGADLVFAELFASHQGVAMWGASSLAELIAREKCGWGGPIAGLEERRGLWLVVPPDQTSDIRLWQSDPVNSHVDAGKSRD